MALAEKVEQAQRKRQEKEFTAWIIPSILAEIIFEELESAGHEPTLENAKLVYLDILENSFYEAVTHCLNYNPAFEVKPVPTT